MTGREPGAAAFQASAAVVVVFATSRRLAGVDGGVSPEPSQLASSIRQVVGLTAELSRNDGL